LADTNLTDKVLSANKFHDKHLNFHNRIALPANLYDVAPNIINFKDFAMLADKWLEEDLWP